MTSQLRTSTPESETEASLTDTVRGFSRLVPALLRWGIAIAEF
jgi:hypothetical protein